MADSYYEREDAAVRKYAGRRAEHREGGSGEFFNAGEDGLGFRFDRPLPAWAHDFEDARTGVVLVDWARIDQTYRLEETDE